MYRTIFELYLFFARTVADAIEAFKEAGWPTRILAVFAGITSGWVLKLFYGTFIIDHAMMTFLGYLVTYNLYKLRGKQWNLGVAALKNPGVSFYGKRKGFFDRFWLMTFPLSIISLWIGGALPYLNLVEPESVYFYAFPASWLGVNGNDFMWNGFIIAFTEKRALPLEFLPTTQYFWFNVYAVLYWLSFPVVLGLAVARGRQTAFLNVYSAHSRLWLERAKVFLIATVWLIIDIAMVRFLYWIYS